MTSYGIDPGISRLFPKKKKATWGTGQDAPVAMQPSLDPNQTALADALTGMLSGVQSPQDFLSGLTQFTSGQSPFGGPGGSDVLAALKNAMSGKVDEEAFRTSVSGPMREEWKQYGAPAAREEFVGPGTFWGTARGHAVERGRQAVEGDIAAERGKMAMDATQRALQAALGYGGMMSQNLGNWIKAYVAANPSQADTINSILAYLNTPTQVAYQNPEYIPGAIQDAMSGGGGSWKTSGGFNQGAGNKSQTSAPPVWDPNSLVSKLKYWDYYNIPEEKRYPSIGDAIAKMMQAPTIEPYAGPTSTL